MTSIVTFADDVLLDAARSASNRVLLTSPFLSIRVARQLAEIAESSTASWSLLTRLDAAAAAGGYLSIDGLRALIDAGVSVRHTARLHAKVYLVDDDFALIGSANLTGPGLGSVVNPNMEMSVRLDSASIAPASTQVKQWWEGSVAVSRKDLDDLDRRARELPRTIAVTLTPELGQSGAELAELADLMSDARQTNLWVKAQYGQPNYDQWRSEFWFSSAAHRRPSFAPGDLVLIYSKDVHACYAIVEVIDEPRNDPRYIVERGGRPEEEATRWPWVNRTQPRLVPTTDRVVKPADLGFTGQGLQGDTSDWGFLNSLRLYERLRASARRISTRAPSVARSRPVHRTNQPRRFARGCPSFAQCPFGDRPS